MFLDGEGEVAQCFRRRRVSTRMEMMTVSILHISVSVQKRHLFAVSVFSQSCAVRSPSFPSYVFMFTARFQVRVFQGKFPISKGANGISSYAMLRAPSRMHCSERELRTQRCLLTIGEYKMCRERACPFQLMPLRSSVTCLIF